MGYEIYVEPGDIVLTRGSNFISRAIRKVTKSHGEERTVVNHVGMINNSATLKNANIVEALSKVVSRNLFRSYGKFNNTPYAIYRPKFLTLETRAILVNELNDYVGKRYGYTKIVTHFLDYCIGGKYVFRRLTNSKRYPICSWVVAYAYDAIGFDFDVKPGEASPDDIWDYVTTHPDQFEVVKEIGF